jgi:hypothetical protein
MAGGPTQKNSCGGVKSTVLVEREYSLTEGPWLRERIDKALARLRPDQPLQSLPVRGLDADRGIQRETAPMVPLAQLAAACTGVMIPRRAKSRSTRARTLRWTARDILLAERQRFVKLGAFTLSTPSWKCRLALSAEPRRWTKVTAPKRASAGAPGLGCGGLEAVFDRCEEDPQHGPDG